LERRTTSPEIGYYMRRTNLFHREKRVIGKKGGKGGRGLWKTFEKSYRGGEK